MLLGWIRACRTVYILIAGQVIAKLGIVVDKNINGVIAAFAAMDKNVKIGVIAVAAIILVVAAVLVSGMLNGSKNATLIGEPVSAAHMGQIRSIALNTALANRIGIGSTLNGGQPNYPLTVVNATPLVIDGKMGVIFISADFCPYCATNRWGMMLALMRFGNFSGIEYMTSGSSDVYPDSPTFTFSNSVYTGKVSFDAVELYDRDGRQLSILTGLQNATISKYDTRGSIPFIDFGNKSVLVGSVISPQLLQGKSWDQIIAQINDENLPLSQAVIGNANIFTAYICRMNASLSNESVCQQSYVRMINGA